MDEPLSNLDAALREEMRFEIRDLQGRLGLTMIYVTHDQQEAMVVADRVVVMNLGKVEQVAPPEDIYRRPRTRFVAGFVGQANLIDGEATEVSGGRAVIKTAMNQPCEVVLPNGFDLEPGKKVGIVVRPEDVIIGEGVSEGEANVFQGKLIRRVFLGQEYDMTVRVGEVELRCQAGKDAPPPGENVAVRIPPEAWRVLED